MPAITAGLITGGAGLLGGIAGDIMGMSGAQATNQQNMQIAQMNNAFNAQQAGINRQWQEQMSDTSMQRRVADLKNAGINPLLALGSVGAAPVTGGSTAQSAGLPNLQNPGAAMQGVGNQAAMATNSGLAAYQAEAQLKLTENQGKKVGGEAATAEFEGSPDYLLWRTQMMEKQYGLASATASQATTAAELARQLTQSNIDANTARAKLDQFQNTWNQLSYAGQKAVQTEMVRYQNQMYKAGTAQMGNVEDVSSGWFGKAKAYADATLQTANSAADVAVKAKAMSSPILTGRSSRQTSNYGPQGQYYGGSVTTTEPSNP